MKITTVIYEAVPGNGLSNVKTHQKECGLLALNTTIDHAKKSIDQFVTVPLGSAHYKYWEKIRSQIKIVKVTTTRELIDITEDYKQCQECGGKGGDYPLIAHACSEPVSNCCGGCTGEWEECSSCGGSGREEEE